MTGKSLVEQLNTLQDRLNKIECFGAVGDKITIAKELKDKFKKMGVYDSVIEEIKSFCDKRIEELNRHPEFQFDIDVDDEDNVNIGEMTFNEKVFTGHEVEVLKGLVRQIDGKIGPISVEGKKMDEKDVKKPDLNVNLVQPDTTPVIPQRPPLRHSTVPEREGIKPRPKTVKVVEEGQEPGDFIGQKVILFSNESLIMIQNPGGNKQPSGADVSIDSVESDGRVRIRFNDGGLGSVLKEDLGPWVV